MYKFRIPKDMYFQQQFKKERERERDHSNKIFMKLDSLGTLTAQTSSNIRKQNSKPYMDENELHAKRHQKSKFE